MSRAGECLARLDALGIEYELTRHEALDTMEKCRRAEKIIGAPVPRNIFLCPRNQSVFALYTLTSDAPFRTSQVSRQAGLSRLSFAPEDKLGELMGTYPGAVSPLGLLFDTGMRVRFLLEEALLRCEYLAFHPVDDTLAVKMKTKALLEVFLPACGHGYTLIGTNHEQG